MQTVVVARVVGGEVAGVVAGVVTGVVVPGVAMVVAGAVVAGPDPPVVGVEPFEPRLVWLPCDGGDVGVVEPNGVDGSGVEPLGGGLPAGVDTLGDEVPKVVVVTVTAEVFANWVVLAT